MSFLSLKPVTGLINAHVTVHDANITLKIIRNCIESNYV